MIPATALGLVVAIAALGPGYVFIRVSERRNARAERSGLLETVELAVIGAFATTVALVVVLAIAGAADIVNIHALGKDSSQYSRNHPLRLLWVFGIVVLTAYGIAWTAARLVNRKQSPSIRPAATAWDEAFDPARPPSTNALRATVELRDGRRVEGTLRAATAGAAENRELMLKAPIRVKAGPGAETTSLDDQFMLLREIHVIAVSGRYVPGQPALPREHPTWQFWH